MRKIQRKNKQNCESTRSLFSHSKQKVHNSKENTILRKCNTKRDSKIHIHDKQPLLPLILGQPSVNKKKRTVTEGSRHCNQVIRINYGNVFTINHNKTIQTKLERLQQLQLKSQELRKQLSSIESVMLKFSISHMNQQLLDKDTKDSLYIHRKGMKKVIVI